MDQGKSVEKNNDREESSKNKNIFVLFYYTINH